jgi:hypothetical protein
MQVSIYSHIIKLNKPCQILFYGHSKMTAINSPIFILIYFGNFHLTPIFLKGMIYSPDLKKCRPASIGRRLRLPTIRTMRGASIWAVAMCTTAIRLATTMSCLYVLDSRLFDYLVIWVFCAVRSFLLPPQLKVLLAHN